MNQSIMMDFEIVTFWGKFWVRKGIMKSISIILFWKTVMIFGTWLWEYGLILVAPVDFEIITWFGFAWMPDPAGGAGRTFKSRMCTLIILQWAVGFSKKTTRMIFYFHASGPLKERSRSHLGPPRQGRGPNTHDNFDYFAVTGWNLPLLSLKMSLKTTKPFESKFSKKQPWWLMIWIQLSLQGLIFSTGSSSARGNDFFSSDRLASWFGKTVAKKGYKFEKNRGDQLKKGGASERGSILWHWALLSRG